jgi:sulfur relay (sulfurtransferase) DsrF/TusC family protein
MAPGDRIQFGLVVRGHPYRQRSARSELDVALAAAALDWTLAVYFLGPSVLQLAAGHDAEPAMLPPGYRAWAALPELADVGFYAEPGWLGRCRDRGIELILPVEPLDRREMRAGWRAVDRLLVL